MLDVARLYFFAFGFLAVVGGTVGYVRAKSRASLIAGVISGVGLVAAGVLVGSGSQSLGLVVGLVLSIALAGRFVPAFVRTRKPMPAGMMALLAVGGVAIAALLLFLPRG